MWFDEQYAQLKIDQIHSLEIQNSIKQMREQGYTLLPSVLEAEDCKAVIDDFYQFCANNKDHADHTKCLPAATLGWLISMELATPPSNAR